MQNSLRMWNQNGNRKGGSVLQRIFVIISATVASIVWAGISVLVFFSDPDSASSALNADLYFKIVAATVPIGLFWVVAVLHNSLSTTKSELFAIQAEIASLRGSAVYGLQEDPVVHIGAEEVSDSTGYREPYPDYDDITPLPDSDDEISEIPESAKLEPRPPLPGSFEGLTTRTLIQALNFADDENDSERVDAIRKAMENSTVEELLLSAYSVLDYLADRGIDTDALIPSYSRHDIWRAHAETGNINRIGVLGQVGSDQDVENAATLAAKDVKFKNSTYDFLAKVHSFLASVLPSAGDDEIAELGATRTLRAYVLLGNATDGD